MAEKIICALLVVVGVIHLLPLSGVVSAERLHGLYGIAIEDPNLEILMRHRAVLFGLLGAFLIYAAFTPSLQPIAFFAAFVSIGAFFWLAFSAVEFNTGIRKVVIADMVAGVGLLAAVALYYLKARH